MDLPYPGTNFLVVLTEENEHSRRLTLVNSKDQPFNCMACGELLPNVEKFGTRKMEVTDLPAYGKRTLLYIKRQRFRCRTCGKTFLEHIDWIDEDHRITKRCVEYIRSNTLKNTHTDLAEELGVDIKTIWNVFDEWVKEMDKKYKFETPVILGIDEIHALNRPRVVLTNIGESTVIDMLRERKKAPIQNWLMALDRHRVEVITMDMFDLYRDCVQPLFPKVPIVVDKFHVVRMANKGLDSYRISLKNTLPKPVVRQLKRDKYLLLRRHSKLTQENLIVFESWIGRFPVLKEAHRLKEDFFKVYDATSREEAEQRYDAWLKSMPGDLIPHFSILMRAMKNWRHEIFNYFDTSPRVTNAFTESANNLIRTILRDGRGYSFPVLRAKVLYSKRKEFVLARGSFGGGQAAAACGSGRDLGADISTLLKEYRIEPELT